jgi:hypothetical protein
LAVSSIPPSLALSRSSQGGVVNSLAFFPTLTFQVQHGATAKAQKTSTGSCLTIGVICSKLVYPLENNHLNFTAALIFLPLYPNRYSIQSSNQQQKY